MQRINTATKAVDLFGPGKHGFKDGDLGLGIQPTDFNALFFNDMQEEMLAVIEGAGIAPTAGVRNQLQQAINAMIAGATGNDYKASVRVATTASINLAAPGAAIDGTAMVAGDRFLDKDNATPELRGFYIWNGAAVPATRAGDADAAGELTSGAVIAVEEGTTNADTRWMLTTDGPIVLGTTPLAFARQGGGTSFAGIVRLTSAGSGTYNKPSNVSKLLIRCIGGGGGAGGDYGDYGGGGGGGAGGFCEKLITAPDASYAYTIGAGGAGGASAGAGYLGGNSTIAGMTASGGGVGHTGTGYGGVGGAAAGGDLNIQGGGGSGGSPRSVSSAYSSGGCGGSGFWGGGGRAGGASGVSGGAGVAGGGGGGPGTGGSAGAGGAGMIEIWEFI